MYSNTIALIRKEECCGCTGCETVCPTKAIRMRPDDQGFLYPLIGEGCIGCGQCINVCQGKNRMETRTLEPLVYAVKHKDDNIRKSASSGGISFSLCSYIIEHGGHVYGVVYDEKYNVITKKAETIEECKSFFGSKYVQTDLKACFQEICYDLLKKKLVLFFGTSCHVAGLKSFLEAKGISAEYLTTVDLICHGVPSPRLFSDFISFITRRKSLSKFEFRTKQLPWINKSENFGSTITYSNGTHEFNTPKARMYLSLFESNNCLRPYCYTCPFANPEKPSDITIGDYWGIQDIHPEFYDPLGVSGVIIHTDKGLEVFKKLDDIVKMESTIDRLKIKQYNLTAPSLKPKTYDDFWDTYYKSGYLEACRKYAGYSLKSRIKKTRIFKRIRASNFYKKYIIR